MKGFTYCDRGEEVWLRENRHSRRNALKRVLEWKGFLLLTMVGVGGGAPERGW